MVQSASDVQKYGSTKSGAEGVLFCEATLARSAPNLGRWSPTATEEDSSTEGLAYGWVGAPNAPKIADKMTIMSVSGMFAVSDGFDVEEVVAVMRCEAQTQR